MRKHEKNSDKEDDFVAVDPLDMSDEEVQSNDEKKSNSKGSKAKSDRRYGKTLIGRERALSISLAMKNLVMMTQKG
ncbi:hypothetical protein Tco_1282449 [Tanacetum coccineum]